MILVRAYSPLGFYPAEVMSHPEGVLVLDDDLIFSAVPEREIDVRPFPERIWVHPTELRLLAAVTLSVQHRHGKVYTYPDVMPVRVDVEEDQSLEDQSTQEFLRSQLIEELSARSSDHNPLFYTPVPRPPHFSGHTYSFNKNAVDVNHQREVFESIDLDDDLLVRGLGALLKGEPLNVHHIFHTEACMSLYVAMEAAMHIVLRRLQNQMDNPSSRDASQYIADAFGNSSAPDQWFEEYYNDRIRTVHPNSRHFGVFPYAPLAADDYYDLYDQLRSLYDFLITGRIDPAFTGR